MMGSRGTQSMSLHGIASHRIALSLHGMHCITVLYAAWNARFPDAFQALLQHAHTAPPCAPVSTSPNIFNQHAHQLAGSKDHLGWCCFCAAPSEPHVPGTPVLACQYDCASDSSTPPAPAQPLIDFQPEAPALASSPHTP